MDRESEISNFRKIIVKENICYFDVSVNDTHLWQVSESFKNPFYDWNGLYFWDGPIFVYSWLYIPARAYLHDNVNVCMIFYDFIAFYDIFMVDKSQYFDLALYKEF